MTTRERAGPPAEARPKLGYVPVQEFDRTGSISLRNFYLRRALRLGPALVAMLIVLCILSFVLFDLARAHELSRRPYRSLITVMAGPWFWWARL